MTHAGVCFERRLPRKIRSAKLLGTLDVGHVSLLTFLPCSKKVSRLPGRDPASCSKQCQLAASIASHTLVATAELLQSAKIVRASVKRLAKYGFAMLTVLTMPPLDGACTNWLLPA